MCEVCLYQSLTADGSISAWCIAGLPILEHMQELPGSKLRPHFTVVCLAID